MSRILFAAIFRPVGKAGHYSVDFPDLPGCVSAGDSLEETFTMASEALSLHLFGMKEDGETIPLASDPASIGVKAGEFVSLVEARPDLVGDEIRNRSVKKTLTLPKWLNDEAERRRINFSQVLQEALKKRIGV